MELLKLSYDLTICKLSGAAETDLDAWSFFVARTDEYIGKFRG